MNLDCLEIVFSRLRMHSDHEPRANGWGVSPLLAGVASVSDKVDARPERRRLVGLNYRNLETDRLAGDVPVPKADETSALRETLAGRQRSQAQPLLRGASFGAVWLAVILPWSGCK